MESSRILLIAMTSFAGMGPYIATIVNSFSPNDNVEFFLVEREDDNYYSQNIRKDLLPKCTIVCESIPSKLKTLYNITLGGTYKFAPQIKYLCHQKNIKTIHALTSLTDVKLTKYLAEHYNLIYTIHDLHPHEAQKVFYKRWRQNVLYNRTFKAIEYTKYLHTNSLAQLKEQQKLYPSHKSFYTPFPTLITPAIANGDKDTPELNNVTNYVLFFGRIEKYKGIDILLHAFRLAKLPERTKLVIAGRGEINIADDSNNIIFINRYIDDQEIAQLYKNAVCVVYPYISATQSGVLSVASYFSTPIITSNIPFFNEVLGESYPFFFESNNASDLADKLTKLFSESSFDFKSFNQCLYNEKYNSDKLKNQLLEIYYQLK